MSKSPDVWVEHCANPWNGKCESTNVQLYIYYKGQQLTICRFCWAEIADADVEWGEDCSKHNGKFVIYTSPFTKQTERIKTVGRAVVRIAERLGAGIDITQRRDVLSIFVYYKNGGKERIPVYCDWGKNWSEKDIYHALRSVVYALSFHP